MDKKQITSELLRIVQPYLHPAVRGENPPLELTGNEHLVNDLRVDSVDVIEIILDIEKEFMIEIPDEQIRRLITLNDLTDLVIAIKNKDQINVVS